MIHDRVFLDLERSLVSELLPKWLAISKKIIPKIAKEIKARDFSKVAQILNAVKVSSLTTKKSTRIKLLFKTTLLFGASRISLSAKELYIKKDAESLGIVSVAYSQYLLILNEMMVTTSKQIMAASVKLGERLDFESTSFDISSKSDKASIKKIEPINLINLLETAVVSSGRTMINIASSLQMSRLSGFGMVSEATLRGITVYTVNEVLDGRTCPVCRRMHGKEFRVKDALEKLDKLIRITDVSELKATSPFPKQDAESLKRLDTMTSEQLRARGFDTPPYHPMCRGLLTIMKNTPLLDSVAPLPLVTGLEAEKAINPRIAQFIDSQAGQQLSVNARESLIAISVGVTDFQKLPASVRDLIEQLE